MSILSGFFKTKRYRKTTDGYKLESNWTSGNTVELDDGNTVQNNLGAIKGITTSTSVAEEGYAADATTVAALNNSLGIYKELSVTTDVGGRILFTEEQIPSKTKIVIICGLNENLSRPQVVFSSPYRYNTGSRVAWVTAPSYDSDPTHLIASTTFKIGVMLFM